MRDKNGRVIVDGLGRVAKMKTRSEVLNDKEIKRLIALGGKIKHNLSCDINGDGLPCRSDRLSAVKLMRKYIDIHDVKEKK